MLTGMARAWTRGGWPLPVDYDRPDAQPAAEEARRYLLQRGRGDGRTCAAPAPAPAPKPPPAADAQPLPTAGHCSEAAAATSFVARRLAPLRPPEARRAIADTAQARAVALVVVSRTPDAPWAALCYPAAGGLCG
eukprot:2435750-Pleurochrysis_carterae.AAC.1